MCELPTIDALSNDLEMSSWLFARCCCGSIANWRDYDHEAIDRFSRTVVESESMHESSEVYQE